MSDDIQSQRSLTIAMLLFAAIATLILSDLIMDYREGASWVHLGVELTVLLASAAGVGSLWGRFKRAQVDLDTAIQEADQWREESREAIRGLGIAIDNQFQRWGLTKAEAEVGLLLLKGLSHKEIASIRGTTERTAREQARALYQKSALSGRSMLSAFFLEDLLIGQ